MSDNSAPPVPRQASTTEHTLSLAERDIRYRAIAEWQTLFDQQKPIAEMFYVAYLAETEAETRPLTFVFNGGPGAASVYLHLGALGPKRVYFGANGSLPKPPVRVVDNLESWLSFTDLVFIDPIGTGFSRSLPPKEAEAKPDEKSHTPEQKPPEIQFWEVDRDLNALGEFISRFLSQHHRWLSPIFIAGESYGGAK